MEDSLNDIPKLCDSLISFCAQEFWEGNVTGTTILISGSFSANIANKEIKYKVEEKCPGKAKNE